MTPKEIVKIFVDAMWIERRLPPMGERPSKLRGQNVLPFVHDYSDRVGWFPAPDKLKSELGDQLMPGDQGRYDEERLAFWAGSGPVTPEAMTKWELALDLMGLVEDEGFRRALWAYAKRSSGGPSFAAFCRVEGISRQIGEYRRKRAIDQIIIGLARRSKNDCSKGLIGALLFAPENSDKKTTIDGYVTEFRGIHGWRDSAFEMIPRPELQDFSWAAKRNEMRKAAKSRKKRVRDRSAV